jgi:hypothetical protein
MQVVVVLFAVISLVTLYEDEKYELITSERNFYGTVKVYESLYEIDGEDIIVRSMANGATTHGFQVVDDRYSEEPVSYYTENSGIDVALRSFVESDVSPRVGVVGLGAGVMSVFCRDLAQLDYLEINPTVERLAREHFSYLEMCPEKTTVAIGDGRLLLEEEAEGRETRYEVIVIDAFTDDAIPSHLLTNEAFVKAYQPLLTEDGVMAIHISNRYLDLRPPIAGIARNNGYEMLTVENRPESSDSTKLPTSWVLIVPPEKVDLYLVYKNVKEYNDEVILWTDQKNSVMSVLSVTGSMKVNQ